MQEQRTDPLKRIAGQVGTTQMVALALPGYPEVQFRFLDYGLVDITVPPGVPSFRLSARLLRAVADKADEATR